MGLDKREISSTLHQCPIPNTSFTNVRQSFRLMTKLFMQATRGKVIFVLGISWVLGIVPRAVFSQSIVPATDGTGTIVTPEGDRFNIEGGQLSGDDANLFHSFEEFGLSEGQIANFIANPHLENILGRVTGGHASYINGLIQVSGGDANLFLMNPAGMVFGPDAALNVPADFTATTATGIGLGDNWFNAFGDNHWSALLGSPNAFSFATSEPGAIVNESNLAVSTGQNLSLFGGTVVNTGNLSAPNGNITVTAVPRESLVRLSAAGNVLNLEIAEFSDSATPLSLPQLLTGGAFSGNASQLVVNGDGTVSLVGSEVDIAPGDAIVSGSVSVRGNSSHEGLSLPSIQVLGTRVGLFDAHLDASGVGGGGNIFLGGDFRGEGDLPNARVTLVDGNSSIFADAIAFGDGGEIILWADDTTAFWGKISARGGSDGGNGGFVEVSGKDTLIFRGDVDTRAPQGLLGMLLLDPVDITIAAGTGDGATDGDDTFAGNPSGTVGQVEAADTAPTTIYQSELEGLAGDTDIVLEASNDITLEDGVSLFLAPGSGSVTFTADSDRDGEGAFSMSPADSITALGRNLEISGAGITVGSIDTSDIGMGGGNIFLNSSGDLNALDSHLFTSEGGNITLSAVGNLNTDFSVIQTSAGGNISLSAGGTLDASGNFIETSAGGEILLRADGDVSAIDAGLFSLSDFADAGKITVESTNGSIDASAIIVQTFANGGNGGAVTVSATGDIIVGDIDAGSFDFDGAGTTGGTITIESGGSIETTSGNNISSSALSLGGLATGGNITLIAENEIIANGLDVSTEDAFGFNPIVAGNINVTSRNGSIEIRDNIQAQASGSGSGGNVNLEARDNITVNAHIDVNGSEVGGDITLTSTSDDGTIDTRNGFLSTFAIDDVGVDARAGNVTIASGGDVLTSTINSQAGIQGGEIQVTSRNGSIDTRAGTLVTQSTYGTAGNVTLNANGSVTSQTIASSAPLRGGNLHITSTNGGINTSGGDLGTLSENGNAGDVTLESRGNITTANIASSSQTGDGGHLSLRSTQGNIATGNLNTFTNGNGAGGQIDLASNTTATSSVTTGNISTRSNNGTAGAINVTAYSNIQANDIQTFGRLDSGDITLEILDSGDLSAGNITTETTVGVSGNITINGTNVETANVQSIGTTGSGDIEIIAADGITTQTISTTTNTGDSGDIDTTSGGDTMTGDVTTSSGRGNSGDIDVDAGGEIATGDVTSAGDEESGDVRLSSGEGSIETGDIETEARHGDSGEIEVDAQGNITTGEVRSTGGGNSGDITLTSREGNIDTGDIASSAQTGTSGDITVTAAEDIETGDVTSTGAQGSGDITLTSQVGAIETGEVQTDTGVVRIDAPEILPVLRDVNVETVEDLDASQTDIADSGAIASETTSHLELAADLTVEPVEESTTSTLETNLDTHDLGQFDTNVLQTDGQGTTGESAEVLVMETVAAVASPTADVSVLPALRNQTEASLDVGNLVEGLGLLDRLYTQEYEDHFRENFSTAQPTVFEIQAKLGQIDRQTETKTGVIYTMVRDDRLELILVAVGSPPIHRTIEGVDRPTLLDTVAALRREVTDRTRLQSTSYLKPAQQLHQWLVSPVEDQLQALGVDTLIFCMDEGLRLLPIAALHDTEQFLVEKYGLSIIPSLGLLDLNYINLQNAQVLAMGASEFASQSPLPAVPAELSLITGDLEILQGNATTKEKANSTFASGLRNGRAFLNNRFTLDTLQTQSQQQPFGILHLATHAQFQPGQPENSYIQFWDESLPLDRFSDLGLEKSSFELLVLSACRTAFGDTRAELGFAGLAVRAGAQSALASLWYVSDDGTLALMSEFYSHLDRVKVKTEALRQAQIAMIRERVYLSQDKLYFSQANEGLVLPENLVRSGRRSLSHPYYWSSFTTIGNPW